MKLDDTLPLDLSYVEEISILYVEDDKDVHKNTLEFLKMYFKTVYDAYSGIEGLHLFHENEPDVVLTDIRMPEMDGLEMAERIKKLSPDTPIIIISAFYETDLLQKSIDIGIDKYVHKPTEGDKLLNSIVRSALPVLQAKEIQRLNQKIYTSIESRLSKSNAMKDVIKGIHKVAKSDFSVIIQGETGVGKSFVAHIIHDLSSRSHNPFITVDIGSLPETLVESELFGHTKGAFTGADKSKKGFFEIAHGGTLFLEELENMTPYVQGKLLRAVEEKRIFPVGSTTPVDVDFRIIGASNKNLFDEVKNGNFREDLYYRLCEFDLNIPPLRERPEDIRWLVERFVHQVAEELDKKIVHITPEAFQLLESHQWLGNVREMKNAVRRMVLMCETQRLTPGDVNRIIKKEKCADQPGIQYPMDDEEPAGTFTLSKIVEEAEKRAITRALVETGGKKVKTATLLGIDYKTLVSKMKKFSLS